MVSLKLSTDEWNFPQYSSQTEKEEIKRHVLLLASNSACALCLQAVDGEWLTLPLFKERQGAKRRVGLGIVGRSGARCAVLSR